MQLFSDYFGKEGSQKQPQNTQGTKLNFHNNGTKLNFYKKPAQVIEERESNGFSYVSNQSEVN